MSLMERVQRALCEGAIINGDTRASCPFCKDDPDCGMWPTFEKEARLAIAAVRKSDRGK